MRVNESRLKTGLKGNEPLCAPIARPTTWPAISAGGSIAVLRSLITVHLELRVDYAVSAIIRKVSIL